MYRVLNFQCPHCFNWLVYRGIVPLQAACPFCQSLLNVDSNLGTSLLRAGPPSTGEDPASVIGGAALGAIVGGGIGLIVGGFLGVLFGRRQAQQ